MSLPQLDTKNYNNEKKIINRLVLINPHLCMLCNKIYNDKILKMFEIGQRWGWVYCDSCIKNNKLKEAVLNYINKLNIIPFMWLNNHESFTIKDEDNKSIIHNSSLLFYRYSQKDKIPIHTAQFGLFTFREQYMMYVDKYSSFHMLVKFNDNNNNKISNTIYERSVSLQNLFRHNDNLYEALINCTNLFDSDMIISYNELSDNIKNNINEAYKLSSTNNFLSEGEK
jgi:hypothetical protein